MATVVTDFNETLVRERTLIAWCCAHMRRGPARRRLRHALVCLPLGAVAMALDRLGADTAAARLGMVAFRGSDRAALRRWATTGLSGNPAATQALQTLAAAHGPLTLVVVSRGTPADAVRGWLDGDAGCRALAGVALAAPPRVVAPELEERGGRLTGRVVGSLLRKRDRTALVGAHGIYLGDRRDARWAWTLGDRFQSLRR